MSSPPVSDLVQSLLDSYLTDEQKGELEKLASSLTSNITPAQAMEMGAKAGIDVEKLRKNIGRMRAEFLQKNRKAKIGVNDPCPCQSGKKYKKCCRLKDSQPTQK